ncbi:MAG: hypothetical protein JJU02_15045 [Cryomorphaceae bacterium]|nr:hypothetical protein [Cryomorphaceae bacterium]
MKRNHIFASFYTLGLLLVFPIISQAQNQSHDENSDTTKFRRFFTAIQFGTGNSAAHTFLGDQIKQNGFTQFTGALHINLEIGYALTKSLHIRSGLHSQVQTLRFSIDDEDHTFNGVRHHIPLYFRKFYQNYYVFNDYPIRFFTDFGGYYAFHSDGELLGNDKVYSAPFKSFGGMVGLGLEISDGDRSNVTIAYNTFGDLFGETLRVGGGFFALGIQTNF